jgi:trypsin
MRFFPTLLLAATLTSVISAYDGTFTTRDAANATERAKFAAALKRSGTTTATRSNYYHSTDPAIVGGQVAGSNEFTWFGRIDITIANAFDVFTVSCGASLIHRDIAVSAAHCIVDAVRDGASFTIDFNLGANLYSGSDGTVLSVQRISWPDAYNFPENDIVFLKLETSTSVTPVRWNTDPLIPQDGNLGKAVGFGLTSDDGDGSLVLLKVDLPAISNAACKTFYSFVPDTITCAYAPNSGKDICQGDSGGPIITQGGILYGITSFSNGVCTKGPAGFTRTSFFRDFISSVRTPPDEMTLCHIFHY